VAEVLDAMTLPGERVRTTGPNLGERSRKTCPVDVLVRGPEGAVWSEKSLLFEKVCPSTPVASCGACTRENYLMPLTSGGRDALLPLQSQNHYTLHLIQIANTPEFYCHRTILL
jgi:hypothetical protein